jgi:3-oxoacyl-(acyl-carrier-protein) synthase
VSRRRVAVTGLGIVCPVGNTVEEAWGNLVAGKPGIGPITRFDATSFACRIAGEVKGFQVSKYLPPKEARHMDVFIHYGLAAGSRPGRTAACRSPRATPSASASTSAPGSAACRASRKRMPS